MTVLVEPILQAKAWGWRHTGCRHWAVKELSFSIAPGEKILLLGPSGAGKSTLLHGLAGLLSEEEGESSGTMLFDGQPLTSTDSSVRAAVGLVQQDPDSQIVMDTIGNEVAFGCENLGIPADQIWPRVRSALKTVGMNYPLEHPTDRLSGGEKQRLALASALAMQPKILLLDEPTANLDPTGVNLVCETVGQITKQTDCALIIIEHRVDTWIDLVDRIIVLGRDGIIADGPAQQVLEEQRSELLDAGIWVPGSALELASNNWTQSSADTGENTLLQPCVSTTELAVGYGDSALSVKSSKKNRAKAGGTPVLSDLNLEFPRGISTCITGKNGTGKTTLALTLAGLLSPVSGQITPDTMTIPNSELPAKVGMVFQEPSYQFLCSTVREELEFGLAASPDNNNTVDSYLERLQLTHLQNAHPQTLSGGEKRRLSVGAGLIAKPEILILDEPTFGQDRNTWIALVGIIQELAAQGTSVISITHDQKFVEAVGQTVINLDQHTTATTQQTSPKGEQKRLPELASKKNPLTSVNPLTQIIGLALLTMPLILTIDIVSAAVALGIELIAVALMGWGPRRLLGRIWPLLIAAPLAAGSMLLYATPGGAVFWAWGPINITENSATLALAIALRVLAVGIPAVVILGGLNSTAVADSLTQKAHLPAKPVLASLAGIRLVSLMMADWQALQRARRSRGVVDKGRVAAFMAGNFALLTFALRRAGTLSVTMEARGFGAGRPRTHARTSTVGWADAIMLMTCILIPVISLGFAVWFGTFRWFGM